VANLPPVVVATEVDVVETGTAKEKKKGSYVCPILNCNV